MAFIIYGAPRSRTAWVAHFLNYPLARPPQGVGHELAIQMGDVGSFLDLYRKEGMFGSVEIEAIMAWRIIKKEMPDLKIVAIKRPLIESYNSLAKAGFIPNLSELAELDAMLEAMIEETKVYTINSSDLDAPIVCKWLFEYCLELEFDFDWWAGMQSFNIQMDLSEVVGMKEDKTAKQEAHKVMTWKDMLDDKRASFRADVISRMKEINLSCLH